MQEKVIIADNYDDANIPDFDVTRPNKWCCYHGSKIMSLPHLRKVC